MKINFFFLFLIFNLFSVIDEIKKNKKLKQTKITDFFKKISKENKTTLNKKNIKNKVLSYLEKNNEIQAENIKEKGDFYFKNLGFSILNKKNNKILKGQLFIKFFFTPKEI